MEEYLIYINLDGLGQYYLDTFDNKEKDLPTIFQLMKEGVSFESAYTGIPSITFPMQCAIVSGTYSTGTGNCYKYLDRQTAEIVLQGRYNRAETIGDILKRQGIPMVSIQQFALKGKGCNEDDQNALYIEPSGDYKKRFDILEHLIKSREIVTPNKVYRYEEIPKAIFVYIDDLDTIGHNKANHILESRRVEAVRQHIMEIDKALGKVIKALKEKRIYEQTTLLITSDHGMISFKGESCIRELKKKLHSLSFKKVIAQSEGYVEEDFDVLITSSGIQAQVYFKREGIDVGAIKSELLKEPYIEKVITKEEFGDYGLTTLYGDLVVSPIEGRHFNIEHPIVPTLQASHDSLNEKAQKVFALLKGPRFKRDLIYKEKVFNIDFIPTVCYALKLPQLKDARGHVLLEIMKGD